MSRFILHNSLTGQAYADLVWLTFPGGERHVRLPDLPRCDHWTLEAHLHEPAGVVDLLLLENALRARMAGPIAIRLLLPYVPYARQDRIAVAGEAFSAQVFCRLINSLGFEEVEIWDPHSDVVVQLLDRVKVTPASALVPRALLQAQRNDLLSNAVLVAPDQGARHRVQAVAQALKPWRQGQAAQVLQAYKHRDPVTGLLSCPTLEAPPPVDRPLLVVDDICDAGGTFLQLAKALRGHTSAPLFLYVTHGIFSKGRGVLSEWFDDVLCANPFSGPAPLLS